MVNRVLPRLLLLLGAGLALVTGLIGGLGLMDVFNLPVVIARAQQYHGALMVFGFVGTAITLERAVALRTRWALLGPLLLILGSITSIFVDAHLVGALLWVVGFSLLVVIYLFLYRRSTTMPVVVQTIGAVAAVLATLRWASTQNFADALILAVIFIVITVIGERVELASLNFRQNNSEAIIAALGLLLLACGVVAIVEQNLGIRAAGLVLLTMVVVMYRKDVARTLIHSTNLPRFSALCMCLAYFWLAVGSGAWLVFGFHVEGYRYDVLIHSIFLGFVMSMIFAHAPIIFTSVLRRPQVFSNFLYLPVVILHSGLVLRIFIGDLTENVIVWRFGGILNVVAIVLFMVTMVILLLQEGRWRATTERA